MEVHRTGTYLLMVAKILFLLWMDFFNPNAYLVKPKLLFIHLGKTTRFNIEIRVLNTIQLTRPGGTYGDCTRRICLDLLLDRTLTLFHSGGRRCILSSWHRLVPPGPPSWFDSVSPGLLTVSKEEFYDVNLTLVALNKIAGKLFNVLHFEVK